LLPLAVTTRAIFAPTLRSLRPALWVVADIRDFAPVFRLTPCAESSVVAVDFSPSSGIIE